MTIEVQARSVSKTKVKTKAKKKSKTVPATKQKPSDLQRLVGKDVYATWVAMLKKLVPDSRTHRLSVLVAAMLQYAASLPVDEDDPAAIALEDASQGDPDEAFGLLKPMLERLFKEAGVKAKRTSSRGHRYSILEDSVEVFVSWYNMPWE